MEMRRTDLAVEARELWQQSAQKTTDLPGVKARTESCQGLEVTRVEILDEEGEKALGKPKGTYLTVELPDLERRDRQEVLSSARVVAEQVESLLKIPKDGLILVVGLGNRDVTADAVGPRAMESVLVTRHLIEAIPEHFDKFRPVAAVCSGVLGDTGVESGELIQALAEKLKPNCVVAVDALAARSLHRVCRTIQIADTGIIPGSGVGNHRMALNQETLGVPVIALGVPTVVDAATLCIDLLEQTGQKEASLDILRDKGKDLFVTPKNVDSLVISLARVLGLGISTALHVDLYVEDVEMLLS